MKKLFASLLMAVLLVSTISTSVCAATLSGWGYITERIWISFDTGTGLVKGDSVWGFNDDTITEITIPSTSEEYAVTGIASSGFESYIYLETITFPDSITSVD